MPITYPQDSEQTYRVLAETASDAIITMDAESIILSVNPAAERIFGYAAEEMLGQPLTMLIPERLREAHRAGVLHYLQTGVRNIPWTGIELPGRNRNGEEIPLEISFGEFFEGGQHIFTGFVRDISERVRQQRALAETAARLEATLAELQARTREVEEAHRWSSFLAEASRTLASSLDYETTLKQVAELAVPTLADWCVVDVVEAGDVRRVNVAHADPAHARLARALCRYPLDPDRPPRGFAELQAGQAILVAQVSDSLLEAVARDAEHLHLLRQLGPCSLMLAPLLARERMLGTLLFLSAESGRRYDREDLARAEDLAGRAALAIDNARLYQESQEANRAKSDFLSVMSHELRTPLSAIIGYSELLELGIPDPTTPQQQAHLDRIESAAKHLLQIIEEILTLTSLEAERAEVRGEEIALDDILRRAAALIEPAAAARGLSLRVSAPQGPVRIETDPGKLLQIVLNLLSNAIKFTDEGEIHLSGQIERGSVVVQVADTGRGIAPEHLDTIFEPFWQVEQSTTRSAGGTGLGLTVARKLARLLGGELSVQSTPGVGSAFTLRLPVRLPAPRTPRPAREPASNRSDRE